MIRSEQSIFWRPTDDQLSSSAEKAGKVDVVDRVYPRRVFSTRSLFFQTIFRVC